MRAKEHPVIIVRRKKAGHGGHHGGAWKVAYADFVTAMMAFFLVMWLSAQDSRIREAVAGYFAEPGLMPHERSNSMLESGRGGIDPSGMTVLNRQSTALKEAEQKSLAEAAERIRRETQAREFASLRDQVELSVTTEGLRIELVERNGSSFFDSGSALLRGESVKILSVIAREIGKLENDVVIEGHTDSRQYTNGERYGNWELSSDRANAARRVMLDQGLRDGQLRAVRGFADNDLRIVDQPLDARNRRVSIVVRSQVAAELETAVRQGLDGVLGPAIAPPRSPIQPTPAN
jgi:chemotaxis protein MotB